jgi:hypothetical protein
VRALALEEHAGEHQDRGDGGQAEHQPPVLAGRQPVVDQVGGEDAGGDGQLVEADHGAADPRRDDLADVQRHDHRRGADRQPNDDAGGDQDAVTGGKGGEHHPGDEESRRAQHRGPAACPVGDPPARQRADQGSDQQDAGEQFLVEGRQAGEVLADEQQRPGDDPGVVAEQQPAERSDRRAEKDMAADGN